MVGTNEPIRRHRPRTVRSETFRRKALNLLNGISIGLRSGEYCGRYCTVAPTASITSFTPGTLWAGRLSITSPPQSSSLCSAQTGSCVPSGLTHFSAACAEPARSSTATPAKSAVFTSASVQNMPMPPGSRRRMTPLSRPDPVLRFVLSRQRFVHRCHGRKRPQLLTAGASWQSGSNIAVFDPSALHYGWAETLLAYQLLVERHLLDKAHQGP